MAAAQEVEHAVQVLVDDDAEVGRVGDAAFAEPDPVRRPGTHWLLSAPLNPCGSTSTRVMLALRVGLPSRTQVAREAVEPVVGVDVEKVPVRGVGLVGEVGRALGRHRQRRECPSRPTGSTAPCSRNTPPLAGSTSIVTVCRNALRVAAVELWLRVAESDSLTGSGMKTIPVAATYLPIRSMKSTSPLIASTITRNLSNGSAVSTRTSCTRCSAPSASTPALSSSTDAVG